MLPSTTGFGLKEAVVLRAAGPTKWSLSMSERPLTQARLSVARFVKLVGGRHA